MSSHQSTIPVSEAFLDPAESSSSLARPEPRWSLGFVAMLLYLFVEYMRLSAQYAPLRVIQVGKLVAILGLLGWFIAPRIRGDRQLVRQTDLGMAALLLAGFLSACFASDQMNAWTTVADFLRWILVYFLIGRIVASPWRLRIFMFLLLLLNLKMAQAAIRGFFNQRAWGHSDELLAKIGVGAGSVGFFSNAGDFGVGMSVVWPLAGILILAEKKWIPRGILLASFVGISWSILVCGSRGAVLAALVTAVVAWARNPKRIGMAVLFLAFIPVVIYLLPDASKARMRSGANYEQDKTATHRMALWRAGLRMFRDNPILGVGPGNYPANYSAKYSEPDQDPKGWVPHSIYVETLSEMGLAGAIPFGFLVFTFFRLNSRTRKHLEGDAEKRKSFEYVLALGLDLAVVGYLVSGAFLTVFYYPHFWVMLGLSVGLHTAVTSRAISPALAVSMAPSVTSVVQI